MKPAITTAVAALAIQAMAGCGRVEVGPSYADAEAVATPHCTGPLVSLPMAIDRDVRAIRLTGRWEENVVPHPFSNLAGRREEIVVPYLFGNPAYAFIERELEATRPDGTRLIRFAAAGPSRDAGTSRSGNRIQACPEGAADLGPHPSARPYRSDGPRACATMQALFEPTTRWQIRRTVDEGRRGSFRWQTTTDEIVDTREGTVLGHARRVAVDTDRETTAAVVVGLFPIVGANYRVKAGCGRTLEAADILRLLTPPARGPIR